MFKLLFIILFELVLIQCTPEVKGLSYYNTKTIIKEISSILKDDKSKWEMIYKGTWDGFKAKNFHDKCDNHPNTITIISANNHTFGGFVSIPWHSKIDSSYDSNAFLFSFDTNSKKLTKYNQDGEDGSDKNYSIYGHPFYGPIFGIGQDVNILFFF
jgi:hypothetical protein